VNNSPSFAEEWRNWAWNTKGNSFPNMQKVDIIYLILYNDSNIRNGSSYLQVKVNIQDHRNENKSEPCKSKETRRLSEDPRRVGSAWEDLGPVQQWPSGASSCP
jgi:hypothetical protein